MKSSDRSGRFFMGRAVPNGKKVVLAHGTFDLLHPAHIEHLKFAREQGDLLFVALSSDRMAKLRKGKERPIQPFENRKMVLDAVRYVDGSFEAPHPTDDLIENLMGLIEAERPDVFVTSYKEFQTKFGRRFEELGTMLVLTPEGPGRTTKLIELIIKRYGTGPAGV